LTDHLKENPGKLKRLKQNTGPFKQIVIEISRDSVPNQLTMYSVVVAVFFPGRGKTKRKIVMLMVMALYVIVVDAEIGCVHVESLHGCE